AAAEPRLALGDVHRARGDPSAAREAYREALGVDPTRSDGWTKLGNALVRLRELSEAEHAFREALHHDARLAAAYNGLGVTLMTEGHQDEAARAFERAIELDPRDENPARNLALLR
ncbi:MAG: tetratricopeptide repeat protein, partial [Myxococcota bacterium]